MAFARGWTPRRQSRTWRQRSLGGANAKGRSLVCANDNGKKDTDEEAPNDTKHVGSGGDDGGDAVESADRDESLDSRFSSEFELDFRGLERRFRSVLLIY